MMYVPSESKEAEANRLPIGHLTRKATKRKMKEGRSFVKTRYFLRLRDPLSQPQELKVNAGLIGNNMLN